MTTRSGLVSACVFLTIAGLALQSSFTKRQPPPVLAATAVVGSAAPPVADAGLPVTKAEAEQIGKELERAFNANDIDKVSAILRVDDLLNRGVSDIGLSPELYQQIFAKYQANGGARTILAEWTNGVMPNGFRLLSAREHNGRWSVILRQLLADGRLDYMQIKLYRHSGSGVWVEDVYFASNGEWQTAQFRAVLIGGFRQYLAGHHQAAFAGMEHLQRFQQAAKQDGPEAAYQAYRAVPAEWRALRPVRVGGLWVLSQLPKRRLELATELKAYRETLPDGGWDTTSALIALQFYHSKADLPEARGALRYLDKWAGGDPYLLVAEGRFLTSTGDPAGIRLAEKALAADPTLEDAHLTLIAEAMLLGDQQLALARLKGMVTACGNADRYTDLTQYNNTFAEFVAAPEYKQYRAWLAGRKGK